jgi:hypothetical protein
MHDAEEDKRDCQDQQSHDGVQNGQAGEPANEGSRGQDERHEVQADDEQNQDPEIGAR